MNVAVTLDVFFIVFCVVFSIVVLTPSLHCTRDMSPEDIEKFVQTHTGGSTQDPFAGMTPDEIDAYVKEHNL